MQNLGEMGVGPQTNTWATVTAMMTARRWLVANPDKVPHYLNGQKRGKTDTPEDLEQLGSYEAAKSLVARRPGWFLGFALGPDGNGGHWQGIDFDDIQQKGTADLANSVPGYVEMSPSGDGSHAIGYGVPFTALGSNESGIEAYAAGRYFTVTENSIRDTGLRCLASFVERALVPRHRAEGRTTDSHTVEETTVDESVLRELRSALLSMLADDYHLWIRIGLALSELGEAGRKLWMEWSATSDKFDPRQSSRKWKTFQPSDTGYQAVFAEAMRQGWVNPASKAANDKSGPSTKPSDFQSRIPSNFLKRAAAPPLDLANFPGPVADFARACSTAYGFDQSGLAMAAITAAAAMMNDAYCLEVMPGWHVSARLWTALIGVSASGKSPSLKTATAPIKIKHIELAANYEAELALMDLEPNEPPPPRPALYTSDATIEALSDRLHDNERGMLVHTEEFSSWIGGIDAAGNGQAAKNRGNWLQLYDGGPYQIDRVVRGSILVPNWGASILTASTPSGLADQMKHLPEDGLIQRFIPVIIGPMDHSADGNALDAKENWQRALFWIFASTSRAKVIRFSPEARLLFMKTKADLGQLAVAIDSISSALASHIGKHTEMIARIALVFHIFDEGHSSTLTLRSLQKAVDLMAQLRRHSVALFTDVLGSSAATALARSLAHSLAAAPAGSTMTIGRDWMTQHCRAFQKAKDDRTRREAVQFLEDLDWLRDAGKGNYGGWPKQFEVNQQIFRLYAREGEAHRAQRAAVKAVFDV